MKSEMLKQSTCDFIANNLGNIMETSVSIYFERIFSNEMIFL